MKKMFPASPDVSQGIANRGVRIIEKHFRMHHVDRARDLPEEAKVRLLHSLQVFFDAELRGGGAKGGSAGRGFWANLREKIQNFLSCSDSGLRLPVLICTIGNGVRVRRSSHTDS